MTANQIAYWRLQEEQRANKAREAETATHNAESRTETNRHNLATEKETRRNNRNTNAAKYMEAGAKVASTGYDIFKGVTKTLSDAAVVTKLASML